MKPRHNILRAYLDTGAYLAALLWFTLSPKPVGDMEVPFFPGADKIVHAGMFFMLALLCWRDTSVDRMDRHRPLPGRKFFVLTAAASALTGYGIEIAQWKMNAGRSFEWGDIVADSLGALAAWGAMILFTRIIERRRPGNAPK